MRFALGALLLALLPCVPGASAAAANPAPRDPAAIRELAEGKRKVANAAWWGFDPVNATAALQSAIRSGAATVIVPNVGQPWIVDPIFLESDQEIDLEKGVEIRARPGGFRGKADALLKLVNKSNVTIKGYGAALRMRKEDYRKAPYEKAEWRSCLSIFGGTNIRVLGLTLADSGGDGVYIAGGRRPYSKNILIKDVTADNNYRQGISVISVDGLRIEGSILRGTEGTPPGAGIDFEPNVATDRLSGITMKDCVIENNESYGIWVYGGRLSADSAPIEIDVEGGRVAGNRAGAVFIESKKVKGHVAIRGAELAGARTWKEPGALIVKIEPAAGKTGS
jgi:Right handed beta helix region